jgi:hypothetical protein
MLDVTLYKVGDMQVLDILEEPAAFTLWLNGLKHTGKSQKQNM